MYYYCRTYSEIMTNLMKESWMKVIVVNKKGIAFLIVQN